MSRARPLPPDERRKALVEATLPLLRSHGDALSTRQIAEAAGVAEGTIFRVFESKDDLIHSCLREALSVEKLQERLDAAHAHDLHSATQAIVAALVDHLDEVRTLMSLVHRPGLGAAHADPDADATEEDGSRCPRPDPRAMQEQVIVRVAAMLEPYTTALTTTPRLAATLLIALAFGAHHPFAGHSALDPDTLAHLALTGLSQEP